MNKVLRFILCFILGVVSHTALAQNQKPLIWDYEALVAIRENPSEIDNKQFINTYIAKADSCLRLPPYIVTNKKWSYAEDNHYYCTMAPYWWPVEKDGKIVYEGRDGKVNPASNDLDKYKIDYMASRMQYFSLAYFFTGKTKYFKAFRNQMDAWFINKRTYMYPNFEYAQIVPGQNENRGRGVGILEGHPFNTVLDAYRLVSTKKPFNKKRRDAITKWFTDLGDWMEASDLGIIDSKANSNQGVSYDITLLNISLFVGNKTRADRIVKDFPSKRINKQIAADGKQQEELKRTKAFMYSVYNLGFFVDFIRLADAAGYDLYKDNSVRINKSFEYLLPFVNNHIAFPYQQITDWRVPEQNLYIEIGRMRKINSSIESELSLSEKRIIRKADIVF